MKLWEISERLGREVFDERCQVLDSRFVGPLRILSPAEYADEFSTVFSSLWYPIADTHFGSMIERYLNGIIAEPKSRRSPAARTITSIYWIHEYPDELDRTALALRLYRRAIFLRQLRMGVRRNLLTQHRIKLRTETFIATRLRHLTLAYQSAEQNEDAKASPRIS